ncbi:hypothetical protein SAMN06295885_2383 [Rathayibacter oskolensis]|uniref:Uncharacterized protein n=1 Tax=Rathayibacter oskolensis TaxID=1891671 RepID=A0A1X7P2M5_9MICO|nr:hypothetical protein [Rathayibacter oskolensis]SMH44540.1 hypothetical protein SAMN06295885_2383 [Rathayibacter oskolensis]
MTRARVWWGAAVAVELLLCAVVLAIPVIILLLPNQWQGDSPTVPTEIIVRQALSQAAPAFATAALALLSVLVVAAFGRDRPKRAEREAEPDDGWAEALVEAPPAPRR